MLGSTFIAEADRSKLGGIESAEDLDSVAHVALDRMTTTGGRNTMASKDCFVLIRRFIKPERAEEFIRWFTSQPVAISMPSSVGSGTSKPSKTVTFLPATILLVTVGSSFLVSS